MIIYHTSNTIVEKPDINHSRSNLDFGTGFYTTNIKEQAINYGSRFKLRGKVPILNEYELLDINEYKVKKFINYDEEWLDFISDCRRGGIKYKEYDVIIGGVANDRIFNTIDLYMSGQIPKEIALERLIYQKPNHQMCFINQEVIDKCIKFKGYNYI